MSERSPEQEVISKINSAASKVSSLQADVRLAGLRDTVEDLDTQMSGLRPCVQDLRKRGYVFGKGMETQADGYSNQWRSLRVRVINEIQRQAPLLERELGPLETQLSQVRAGRPLMVKASVDRLESSLEAFEDKVGAVKSSVQGMFDSLQSESSEFKATLDRIDEMLKEFDSAAAAGTIRLLPTEGAVMAVKAKYSRDAKMEDSDPEGFLLLTDQRILFEQNEEVATKKVLFITTEKQKVRKLLLEAPVALLETVQAEKKGLFGHQDHLVITFKSGAPVYQAWFHLSGQDCNEWQQLLGKACSGGLETERAVAIDKTQVEKVKAAPSQCPNCGAPINQVVLRGMDSITCEYCRFVIRL